MVKFLTLESKNLNPTAGCCQGEVQQELPQEKMPTMITVFHGTRKAKRKKCENSLKLKGEDKKCW